MSQKSSSFNIPQNYKIIRVTVAREQLVNAYNDPQIEHNNETALNYLTKDYQGKAQFFDIDFTNGSALISWGVQRGPQEAEDHNKRALSAAKTRDFDKAIEHWRKAVYINRNDPDTLYNLALAYFEISNYTKALDKCVEVLDNCPLYFKAHFLLGSLYSKLRKFEQAATNLKQGLIFQPDNVAALVNLGAISTILKDQNGAIEYFERAISISPKEKKAFLGLGKLYASKNDIENANRCFKAVIKLDSDGKLAQIAKNSIMPVSKAKSSTEADLQNTQGLRHLAKDADQLYFQAYQYYIGCDYSNAIHVFEKYLSEKTTDHRAWSTLSICQLRTGQKQKAIRSIEKALSLQSKNASLLKQASILYDACDMAAKSAETALKAFNMGKNDTVTLTLLGIGKANDGQLQDGARLLYEAINKNPNNLKARYNLASILRDLGQIDSAKQQLEEILWAENHTPIKEKARNLLNAMHS